MYSSENWMWWERGLNKPWARVTCSWSNSYPTLGESPWRTPRGRHTLVSRTCGFRIMRRALSQDRGTAQSCSLRYVGQGLPHEALAPSPVASKHHHGLTDQRPLGRGACPARPPRDTSEPALYPPPRSASRTSCSATSRRPTASPLALAR